MAANPKISSEAAKAALDAMLALLNDGVIEIRTGSPPTDVEDAATGTLLASLDLLATAFGSAAGSGGADAVATANAISGDPAADDTGTAGWFRAYKSDGTTGVIQGTVGGTLQSTTGDLQLGTSALVAGLAVEITSWTVTLPTG